MDPPTWLRRSASFRAVVGAVIGAVLGLAMIGAGSADQAVAAPMGDYVAVNPIRLVDTRNGLPTTTTVRLVAGGSIEVAVLGRGRVPATGVGAVFLNITAVSPAAPGYFTVFPSGSPQPNASTLNYAAGQVVANGALVAVGSEGRVVVYSSAASDLLVDIQGYVPSAGTVVGVAPARLFDTRLGGSTIDGRFVASGRLAAKTVVELDVAGRASIPAIGVGGVFLNVTVVGPATGGFAAIWPAGAARPTASTINFVTGQVVANNAFVGLGSGDRVGKVAIYTDAATDVIIDVVGYSLAQSLAQTGPVALTPSRLLDTRSPAATIDGLRSGGGAVRAQSVVDLVVAGRGGVPASGVGAVIVNVTSTEGTADGFVTAWPSGKGRPVASMLNHARRETVANGTIVAVGDAGKISLYTEVGGHLIVDIVGWMPGGRASPKPMYGLNIAPFIGGPPPLVATAPLVTELTDRVAPYAKWIRTYECSGAFRQFAVDAHRLGMRIALGGWISGNQAKNRQEIDCLIEQAAAGNADLIIVGTEALRRLDATDAQLIGFINEVAATTTIPVTTSETDAALLGRPAVVAAVDVVFANVEPFWAGVAVETAASNLQATYAKLQAASGAKPVIIGETGWPTCGDPMGAAVPSVENAARYLGDLRAWADPAGVPYFWFEAYDQAWKASGQEGTLGACWGLWTAGGEMKRGFRPTFN